MQKKKGKRINFKIVDCSSEDPQYPASQLLQQSPQAKGWKNKRFSTYPQNIVFELFETSVVNKIAVLSHQSKISTNIQFEIKIDQSDEWKKIGRMSFDSNVNTKFQAREFKQANINEVKTRFIRMVLNKNYTNNQNIFNQVGIICVSFYGYSSEDLPPVHDKHLGAKNNMETDTATLNRIKELENKKKTAVEHQNYDLAKEIKDQIDRLRNMAIQISSLEERKQQAIRRQNYDDAKIINEEIKKLRQGSQNYDNPRESKPINRPQIRKHSQEEGNNVSPISNNPKNAPIRQPQPLQQKPRLEKQQKKEQVDPRSYNNNQRISKEQEDRPIVVKNQNPYAQKTQQQQDVKGQCEAQPLNKQLQDQCSQYFSVLDEQIFRHVFSKSHSNRQKGVDMVLGELKRTRNREDFIGACLFIVKNLIDDKIASVLVAAMCLMSQMMKKLKPQPSSYNQPLVEFILDKMSDYIGHMNDKVRQTAEEAYSNFPIYHLIDKETCYRALTSQGKRQKPPKILAGRMSMLNKLIKTYHLGRDYEDVIKYAVKYADDKNNDVRSGAINVLCAIAGEIGYNTLQPSLKNLRPPIIKSIEQKLDQAGNMQYPSLDQKPIKPKTTEKGGPRGKPTQPTQMEGGNQFIEIPKRTMNKLVNQDQQCQFCKRIDKRFVEEDYKDMHYFNACPMLIICSQCGQGIEISTLTSHLVGECANSKYYKKCPRCKEAVHQKTYKAHAQKKQCLSAKPLAAANRCPLCHLDINPGVNGWKQHLVDQGCQNNPRA